MDSQELLETIVDYAKENSFELDLPALLEEDEDRDVASVKVDFLNKIIIFE